MSQKTAPRKSAAAAKPAAADKPTPPAADAKPAASPQPAKARAGRSLSPARPDGYKPQGKVRTLSEMDGVKVVSDDVRVWKEPA